LARTTDSAGNPHFEKISEDQDTRFRELETRLAHLGRFVEEVNEVVTEQNHPRLTMSAKFLGSAPDSGRGILPRRSGLKPLPLFR